jgi:hypothetical protein
MCCSGPWSWQQCNALPFWMAPALRMLRSPKVHGSATTRSNLRLDGLLDKGSSVAEHAVVVNAHLGRGNVRGETIGSYALVFNAILNHGYLAHESAAGEKH